MMFILPAITFTFYPMKRSSNEVIVANETDNKRQKIAPQESSFSDLPSEIKEKIIAISLNKNDIRAVNKELKDLASKDNSSLLLRDPLHLTRPMQELQFIRAVDKGQTGIVKNLGHQGYHKNSRIIAMQPLTLAAQNNNDEMMEELHSLFPDATIESLPRTNRFTIAAYNNDIEEMKALLINIPPEDNLVEKSGNVMIYHPAFIATKLGHLDMLEFFLQRRPNLLQAIPKNNYSLLHAAAGEPFPYITKFLLDKVPLNINAKALTRVAGNNVYEFTPLQIAARAKRAENVELLLKKDATIEQPGDEQNALLYHPAFIAVSKGDLKTLEVLHRYRHESLLAITREGNSILHIAARMNNPQLLEFLLLRLPVEIINKKNKKGFTPLQYAIQEKNIGNIKFLIIHNASIENIEIKTLNEAISNQPAFFAVSTGNLDLLEFLNLYAPESLSATTGVRESLFHLAIDSNNAYAITEYLLKNIHYPFHQNGDTPLGRAIARQNVPLIDLFWKYGITQ